ncbi:PhoH family protein [Vibrio phage henriette 12B8]|uniref:PhoH-like phosphate starvation-inducible n=1 Tax=Vibrio phage henriette 12B8 TaxID=573174 RepID=UPI0002C04EC5|nr:PhoH-like phosphate starvation-inducible [Vibrio phage henriette 12B8]AGG58175.1 PhoH family protein [Vibrio phage henriette 12B8]
MTKCFILDTNVMLNDPTAPFKFGAHHIVIPMAVLEELDNIKMRKNDLSYDARQAIRTINDIVGDKDPVGVPFDDGAHLIIFPDMPDAAINEMNVTMKPDSNDNKIIISALVSQAVNEKTKEFDEVVLVSNDLNMRLKAKGSGLMHAQEYRNDVVVEDTTKLPTGFIKVSDEWLESIPTDKISRKSCGNTVIASDYMPEDGLAINDWLIPEDESWAAVITDFDNETGEVLLNWRNPKTMMSRRIAGINPSSVYQAATYDALMSPDIDIVIIDGAAGSGKTLAALAAATECVKGKKSGNTYDNILYTRANVTDQDDVGFLPGDEMQKMSPWLGAAFDNMKVISRASKNEGYAPENSITDVEKAFIELKAMMFFRGRSISHSWLIIDEAQNITSKQVKTMVSRAGENCKVVIMGNNAQIDNKTLSPRSSGLTYAMNKFHGQDFAQVIKLQGVVRSRLAAFAESDL